MSPLNTDKGIQSRQFDNKSNNDIPVINGGMIVRKKPGDSY